MTQERRHGGPYDRGAADSYYRRARRPHYYEGKTYLSKRIEEENMTPEEIAEYNAGWAANERARDFKDYGLEFDYHDEDEPKEEEEEEEEES